MSDDLSRYISDPENGEHNFSLGLWYEDQGHTAAAAGFYVRTAEFTRDNLLAYEALLRIANCFTRQGCRVYLTKGILLRAISLIPDRPEAYFLLSRLYEVNKDWLEAYAFSIMGQRLIGSHPKLRTNVDYPGPYALVFEQAVSSWWVGLFEESAHLFKELKKDPTILPVHILAVQNNLRNMEGGVGPVRREPLTYYGSMYERLRFKFPDSRTIEQNYSQCYQDMFVLTMLNGKRAGTFFEVGCGDPLFGNNTKLLEEWGWSGISIDIDAQAASKFSKERKAAVIIADAVTLDYYDIINKDYDYLQIDVDPALNSLEVLLRIPFDKHRFSIITFEHDDYCYPGIKERSRRYLESHGYTLVVGDVAPDRYNSFEDWWVHPEVIDAAIIKRMQPFRVETKRADFHMLIQ